MNEPFYELEIKTSNCFIEVLINNLPVFSNYESNGMAVDYPINDAILRSGKQSLEIRILSPKEQENISKYAHIEIKVYVKKANREASGRTLVYELPVIDFKERSLPIFSDIYSFVADVPYKNSGWENSLDLRNIDKNLLIKELEDNLTGIMAIYNSRNEKEYKKLFESREKEHIMSFYLTKKEIEENNESIFFGLPEKIESIDKNLYKLVFYGNNKLVSLQAKHQPPGFVFESLNKDEYGFTEMVLFHKENEKSVLTVIR
jgi:hypothetical protein